MQLMRNMIGFNYYYENPIHLITFEPNTANAHRCTECTTYLFCMEQAVPLVELVMYWRGNFLRKQTTTTIGDYDVSEIRKSLIDFLEMHHLPFFGVK